MSYNFCSSYLGDFRDGKWVVAQLLLFGILQICKAFFSIRLVSVYIVHPYSRIDTTTAWKKMGFILSERFDFHIINNLSIAVLIFASCSLLSFSVDEKKWIWIIYIYMYIYIYKSTIYQHSRLPEKTPPGTRDKNISNHRPGKKKIYHRIKRKKRPTPSHQLKKIKRYAVSWSKEE